MASNTNKIDFGKWKELISKHLGKPVAKHHRKISLDILCVDVGIKPAFLFDYACVTGKALENLLVNLRHDSLIGRNVQLLEIVKSGDFFICEPDFGHMILYYLGSVKFVDISSHLNRPQILSKEMEKSVRERFDEMCLTAVKRDGIAFHRIEFPENTNVTTMFGRLLGYPVIYWYHINEDTHEAGAQGGNCLSMELLVNVKVICGVKPDRLNANEELEHVLWSFSYPACLKEELSDIIRRWFGQVKNRIGIQNVFCNYNIRMCEEHVTLPAVAL